MSGRLPVVITAAVEGILDEAVIRSMIQHVGAVPGRIHGKEGKNRIRARLSGYVAAARLAPWVVLVDLDDEHDCAPSLRSSWGPGRAPRLCFRVAVRMVEAWLLADRERVARFLRIPIQAVPPRPEDLPNPKETMLNLARRSRSRDVQQALLQTSAGCRKVGPEYVSYLGQFASGHWRPDVASARSPSLKRALACLERLAAG